MPRGNPQNLWQNQPEGRFTAEERREWARIAGKASAEKRRQTKRLAEIFRELMVMDCGEENLAAELTRRGVEATFANAVSYAVLRKARDGDIEAFRALRDTIGEKPTDEVNLGLGTPIKALDLARLTDAELAALADRTEE